MEKLINFEKIVQLKKQAKSIDAILDITESTLLGTKTPEDFKRDIDIKALVDAEDFHITQIKALKKGASFPEHMHQDRQETIVVIGGEVLVFFGENIVSLKAGQSLYINSNVMHGGIAIEKDSEILSIIVPRDPKTFIFLDYLKSVENGRQ